MWENSPRRRRVTPGKLGWCGKHFLRPGTRRSELSPREIPLPVEETGGGDRESCWEGRAELVEQRAVSWRESRSTCRAWLETEQQESRA